MNIKIRSEVKAIRDIIIEFRRHLHKYPELAFREFKTAEFVAGELQEWGLKVSMNVGKTGVVGLLEGSQSGPCIGLRADMDGLPIQETGSLPFKSVNDKVMHACGHDGHMAMLLGAASILMGFRDRLSGSVKFIFQPAEEGGGGAKYMIADSVLDNPSVDEIYGIHLWNYQEFGTVGIKGGAILAAADIFTITILGKGGHGAVPQNTVDAIVAASHLVTALQTVVSRNTNPLESTVVTVGMIEGGHNFNVIADKVVLKGTIRAYTDANRQMIIRRMNEIIIGIAKSFGAEISCIFEDGYPPTINSEPETIKAANAAKKIVGSGVQFPYMSMGAEDMSYYLEKVPGCFFFVGSSPEGVDPSEIPHHCSHFDINEEALLVGSSIWVQLIDDLIRT